MFRQATGREKVGICLLLIIGVCSFGAWQFFALDMASPGVADVWWPVLWFAVLAVFFFLGAVIWTTVFMRIAGAALVFLPGLFFIRSWEYGAVGMLSVACMYWGSAAIAREESESMRFHFYKSVRAGSFFFILGLSLLLASGYYVSLRDTSWEELVPRFRVGEEMTRIVFKMAGVVNPSFAQLSEGDMTVDEFLLSLSQKKQSDAPELQTNVNEQDVLNAYPEMIQFLNGKNIPLTFVAQSPKVAEEIFLDGGRKQIASLVGRSIAGDEKISDVLSLALQNKLLTYLRGEKATQHMPSQAIPFFLALLLFLTLLSFASIVGPLCVLVAQSLFSLLLWVGWLGFGKVMVEQERLVE
ncbi:MAG: hypothetical protein WAV46_03570 [Candidatus Moraniibacteriota bacterium]